MTWAQAILICCVVLLALWRRPPINIHVHIAREIDDGDDGDGDEVYAERIPTERIEQSDVTFN